MSLALYPLRVRSNELLDGTCVILVKNVPCGKGLTMER
jgi:hypothetical protein